MSELPLNGEALKHNHLLFRKKYPIYNKQFMRLVVQFRDDFPLSHCIFTHLLCRSLSARQYGGNIPVLRYLISNGLKYE